MRIDDVNYHIIWKDHLEKTWMWSDNKTDDIIYKYHMRGEKQVFMDECVALLHGI